MNSLQQTIRQFLDLFKSMSPSQRATLILVPLVVVIGFGSLLWTQQGSGYTALSWGKVYSTEELLAAEQALLQANLTEFRREGQRLLAPTSQIDRYNAALLEFDAMPADLGSQMMKQIETLGPFSTDRQRQELKEAMLLQELRRTLRAIPDVEDARVVVANPHRRGTWSQRGRVTANVTIKPRGNRELSSKLVHSIRASVASMVPDLKPADVTVFDVINQVAHTGDPADDPFDSRLVQRIKEFTRQYEQQVLKDLSYIRNVGATVHVDIDNLKSSVTRNQIVDPKKSAPIIATETKVSDSQAQQPARGEAGATSNRPAAVSQAAGVDRNRKFTDESTQTVNGVSYEVTEKELIAAMPKAVQVSVTIPRDYYRDVATNRLAAGEKDQAKLDLVAIEKEVLENVQKSVSKLIPAGSPPNSITVLSVDRINESYVEPVVGIADRTTMLVKEWGGAIALAAFAAWVLMMMRKTAPAAPPAPVASQEINADVQRMKMAKLDEAAAAEAESDGPRAPTRRDLIQNIVRDNPEMTASVITKWLMAAK